MKPGQNGIRRVVFLVSSSLTAWFTASEFVDAQSQLYIRDVCRVKGQENNTLQGLGLVAGLKGTGEADAQTRRALAQMMHLMGQPVGRDANGQPAIADFKDVRNVALAFVTVTIPEGGARQGTQLDCAVNTYNAKSLEGGYLLPTPLLARPGSREIYAMAQGPITLDESGPITAGKIHDGCRLERSISHQFLKDGKVTLVLDEKHATFEVASVIELALNDMLGARGDPVGPGSTAGRDDQSIAKALDQVNIEVRVPSIYQDNVVEFLSIVMETRIVAPQRPAQVLIDERNGVVIVGDNVTVGRVAISHKGIAIRTGNEVAADPPDTLQMVDQAAGSSSASLQELVNALNALQVDTAEIIDIIKGLDKTGDLYGRLVIK